MRTLSNNAQAHAQNTTASAGEGSNNAGGSKQDVPSPAIDPLSQVGSNKYLDMHIDCAV